MDKLKGRGKAESYIIAPDPWSSHGGCREGGARAAEPALSPLAPACASAPDLWGSSPAKLNSASFPAVSLTFSPPKTPFIFFPNDPVFLDNILLPHPPNNNKKESSVLLSSDTLNHF